MGRKTPTRTGDEREEAQETDGRALIRERNRGLIEEACYGLLKAGNLNPTADEVADRSGVGRRTVFRHFQSMESLVQSVHDRFLSEITPFLNAPSAAADLDSALAGLAERRARFHEISAPFRRAAALFKHHSEAVREREAAGEAMMRARLEAAVAPHLVDPEGLIMDGLELIFSFEAWDRLRTQQGLSPERARQATLRAAQALASTARRATDG
jgi:AcrR family transcriptional regulator